MSFDINIADLFNAIQGGGIGSIIGSLTKIGYAIRDDKGNKALNFDSIIALNPSGKSIITTAPVEEGKYSSINKVRQPSTINMVGAISTLTGYSGAIPDIQNFNITTTRDKIIKKLKSMLDSSDVYNIETPDGVYSSYDLTDFSYQITAKSGVTLLQVNMQFQEVRQQLKIQVSNDNSKSGQASNSQGSANPSTLDKIKSAAANMEKAAGKAMDDVKNSITTALDDIGKDLSDILSASEEAIESAIKRFVGSVL